jgi:outer membrane murein-binding lipoprotein Lpp
VDGLSRDVNDLTSKVNGLTDKVDGLLSFVTNKAATKDNVKNLEKKSATKESH